MSGFLYSFKEKEQFFRKIIQLYSKELTVYAFHFLRNEGEAQDTVQEAFIRLWERPDTDFPHQELLKRYLYLAVRNACLDKIEKKNVLQRHIDRMSQEMLYEEYCCFDESLIREIKAEIEQLPTQTRKIINGIFVCNKKYQEVADELGISVNTVKTLLKTGLKRLREKFSGRAELHLIAFIIRNFPKS